MWLTLEIMTSCLCFKSIKGEWLYYIQRQTIPRHKPTTAKVSFTIIIIKELWYAKSTLTISWFIDKLSERWTKKEIKYSRTTVELCHSRHCTSQPSHQQGVDDQISPTATSETIWIFCIFWWKLFKQHPHTTLKIIKMGLDQWIVNGQ